MWVVLTEIEHILEIHHVSEVRRDETVDFPNQLACLRFFTTSVRVLFDFLEQQFRLLLRINIVVGGDIFLSCGVLSI